MPQRCITEHSLQTKRHTTFFLAAGHEDGPLIIFIHSWPECSLSWRHQPPFLGGMGFRAVAPDMRGYGKSSVYPEHQSYAQKLIIEDALVALVDRTVYPIDKYPLG